MITIGVAGLFASGKTTIAKALASALDLEYRSYSDTLRTMRRSGDCSSMSMADYGVVANKMIGQSELTRRVVDGVSGNLVVDGLRFEDDRLSLMDRGTFRLIWVECERQARLDRYLSRQPGASVADFRARECHPVEQIPQALCDRSTIIIYNNGPEIVARAIVLRAAATWLLTDLEANP